jgi:ABC transport system ATP-binding/permease protein
MARESNLLVLDEPTNDLDIETLDLLQDLLGDYPGTVLLVSHDRDFIDRVATATVALEAGGTRPSMPAAGATWPRSVGQRDARRHDGDTGQPQGRDGRRLCPE